MSALGTRWHWWRGEIAALLPQRLRNAFAGSVSIIAIDLETDAVVLRHFTDGQAGQLGRIPHDMFDAQSLRAALQPFLAKPWWRREAFALRIADSQALRRNLSLPLAARRDIESLLALELERQSPLDRGEVWHDYRIARIDRVTGRIDIVWRIVRRRALAPALETCRKAGIDLAVIAFTGDEAPPDGGDFPVSPSAALLLRLRRLMVPGLSILVALLFLAVIVGAYLRNETSVEAFAARVDQARMEARQSLLLEHEIAAARKRTALLVHEKQGLSAARVLAEVTRVLPTGSWLGAFDMRDGEVHLQGTSNSAASLIAAFDASPLFEGAEFRAPLMQAQGPGQEQFDIAFKLRRGAR
ncbi:MAG TPA: PilN domain-containing protein [Rhizomicrobium sp.]